MKRTVEGLKASGYLTLDELTQRLADEGVFLGRSPARTIRFYQGSGKIPRPVRAGKGGIAYYPIDTVGKIVALRRLRRISGKPVEDIEAAPGIEMVLETALAYFRAQSPARQAELAAEVIRKVYPKKTLADFLGIKAKGSAIKFEALFPPQKVRLGSDADLALRVPAARRSLRLPLVVLAQVVNEQVPTKDLVLQFLEGRPPSPETDGWADADAYLAWGLVKGYERIRKLMLAGDFERAYRAISWAARTSAPIAAEFLEKRFRTERGVLPPQSQQLSREKRGTIG